MKLNIRYVRGDTEEDIIKKTKKSNAELKLVQKVRYLPGHDRFHLVVVHSGGNLESLIFLSSLSWPEMCELKIRPLVSV